MLQNKVDEDKGIRIGTQEEGEGCNIKYSDYKRLPWKN